MKPMTDREYVRQSGRKCPACRSIAIDGTCRIDIDGNGASQKVVCADCDASWIDLYSLIGYVDLELKENDNGKAEGS